MKIAVTSASGQLGSAIVEQLIKDIGQENVVGIARTPTKASQLGVEVRKGDYTSREDFDTALRGIDRVIILSGNDYPEKRIEQHRNIIEAAKSNGLERIVYTSIMGDPSKTTFSSVIKSNRQTEEDIKMSGLDWVIGRNGIYLEPDIEYLDQYIKEGEIANCAGEGKCGYTSRKELAVAYSKMAQGSEHNGQIYNLTGPPITQQELCNYFNQAYDVDLVFRSMEVAEYEKERKEALGDFLGRIISGIYEGIRNGAFEGPSHYEMATNRPHLSVPEIIKEHLEDKG